MTVKNVKWSVPVNWEERERIARRVGVYMGEMWKAARQYIKGIERQCEASNMEDQRCFIFMQTLRNNDLKDYFRELSGQSETNNWDEWHYQAQ